MAWSGILIAASIACLPPSFAIRTIHRQEEGVRQGAAVTDPDGAPLMPESDNWHPVPILNLTDPRGDEGTVGVIAFYFAEGSSLPMNPWDEICGAGLFGNFHQHNDIAIVLSPPEPKIIQSQVAEKKKATFYNAEAAFQGLKFWRNIDDFEAAKSGQDAYNAKKSSAKFNSAKELDGETDNFGFMGDLTYSGFEQGEGTGSWYSMGAILRQKYGSSGAPTRIGRILMETGDAYLLEHRQGKWGDKTWSDGGPKANGQNWLGMQIMLIRDELTGNSKWTKYIQDTCTLNLDKDVRYDFAYPEESGCHETVVGLAKEIEALPVVAEWRASLEEAKAATKAAATKAVESIEATESVADAEEDAAVEDSAGETTDVEDDTAVEEPAPAAPEPQGIMGYYEFSQGSLWFQWANIKPDKYARANTVDLAMISPSTPIKRSRLVSLEKLLPLRNGRSSRQLVWKFNSSEPTNTLLTSGITEFLWDAYLFGTDFTFLASDLQVKILILDSSMKVSTVKPLETISTADLKAAIVTSANSGEFNNEFSVDNVAIFTGMAQGKSNTRSIVF